MLPRIHRDSIGWILFIGHHKCLLIAVSYFKVPRVVLVNATWRGDKGLYNRRFVL